MAKDRDQPRTGAGSGPVREAERPGEVERRPAPAPAGTEERGQKGGKTGRQRVRELIEDEKAAEERGESWEDEP